jgi:hypothetical protein
MLHDRATGDLQEPYMGSADGDPAGDGNFIRAMVNGHGLRHKNSFHDCCAFFVDLRRRRPLRLLHTHPA